MSSEFESIFRSLKAILQAHADGLSVTADTPNRYCLEGDVGPATLRAWGGKVKRKQVPVAWVQIGKSSVSYHLMGVYGNATLRDQMSPRLEARMTGKSCFNFKVKTDASLTEELDQLTVRALAAFRSAGFISASAESIPPKGRRSSVATCAPRASGRTTRR